MLEFLLSIPGGVWAGILTPLLASIVLAGAKKRAQRDQDGWVSLTPTIPAYVLGVFYILFFLFFLVAPLMVLSDEEGTPGQIGTTLFLAPLLCLLFGYGVFAIFVVRARFNASGIEYSDWRGTDFYTWQDIVEVVDSYWLDSFLRTRTRKLMISKYRKGFPQLVDTLRQQNVKIDDDVLTP